MVKMRHKETQIIQEWEIVIQRKEKSDEEKNEIKFTQAVIIYVCCSMRFAGAFYFAYFD